MFIKIHTHGFELTKAIRRFTESKIHALLEKYQANIQAIEVTMTDINGPKGGEDKLCKIKIKIPGMPAIFVQDKESNLYDAINRCAHRVKRCFIKKLNRTVQRRKTAGRHQPELIYQEI